MAQVKQFEVGKRYQMRSACNHECVWTYKVLARTACTVTLAQVMSNGKTKTDIITCRINKGLSEFCGAESVKPLGSYSMCPILSADNEAKEPKLFTKVNATTELEDGVWQVVERYDEQGINRGCFLVHGKEETKYPGLQAAISFLKDKAFKQFAIVITED